MNPAPVVLAENTSTAVVRYKKAISNKHKFDIGNVNTERAPYYAEGDLVTDLVEKVLRNIIRTN